VYRSGFSIEAEIQELARDATVKRALAVKGEDVDPREVIDEAR
jgi:hypothetical protein